VNDDMCDLCGSADADSIDTGSEFLTLCEPCEAATRTEDEERTASWLADYAAFCD
jgi:hypothetical protein